MKTKLFIITVILLPLLGKGQIASSVADGNWMNPLTWDCMCIPTPGYNIFINHNVTLDTGFPYTSGGIMINTGASLIDDGNGRDIWMNGGLLENNGTIEVRYLYTQSGAFNNHGTITAHAFLNSVDVFVNTGYVEDVDSLYNNGVIMNEGEFLNIDSITNAGTFTNNGMCEYNLFTNTGQYTNTGDLLINDITNTGTFTNSDTIWTNNSFWNTGVFDNQASGKFTIFNDFLNNDISAHDAVFNNNGRVVINDSWYNMDTIKGQTGGFIVADTTYNSGFLKQTFDLCDLTSLPIYPPIDINIGVIGIDVTFCVNTNVNESAKQECVVYPNPANGYLNIETALPLKNAEIIVFNSLGQEEAVMHNINGQKIRIDTENLTNGIYFLYIKSNEEIITERFVK